MRVFLRLSTALLSLLLLTYAALQSAGIGLFPSAVPIDPATAALTGIVLANLHLLIIPGYRRLPFWLVFAFGDIIFFLPVILSVGVPRAGLGNICLHDGAVISASVFLLITARWIASRPVSPFAKLIPAVALLSAFVLLSSQLLFSYFAPGAKEINTAGQVDRIMTRLSPAASAYRKEIEEYLVERRNAEEKHHDEDKAEEDQKLIDELNRRVRDLESERERFERLQKENLKYREEIDRLEERLDEFSVPDFDENDFRRVGSYREAIRPTMPLVRDFSVKLASSIPGTYYSAPGLPYPGDVGIRQVLAIHRYISGSWKYVNDPLTGSSDFLSPADRTIALGLSGDCDDFAILMASCVEAIGGRARILHGTCDEGAHAWCELELGSRGTLDLAAEILRRERPGTKISWFTPSNSTDYWLSLDWEAGSYSCGESAVLIYESGGSR